MANTRKLLEIVLRLKDEMSAPMEQAGSRMERVGSQMQRVGTIMTATVTPAMLALGASAVQAASDWESAFTGVIKTVDGTDEQLAELEAGLRDLATNSVLSSLENAHTEIAGIAETAGQLGVGVDNIEDFTQVIGELSMSTNLAGEEAATMIAQFANVTNMPLDDVRQFGDAIVTLGNNAATTERDILSMASRMGAIADVGFNPDEILAYSSALSSLGISAELGGTNFVRGVNEIARAVATGGESLAEIADVAGMSMTQFRTAFEQDAASAVQTFINGMGELSRVEQLAVLESLGIQGQEAERVFTSLAGNTELLAQQLTMANDAFAGNNALMSEAAQRAQTAQSAWNAFQNALTELRIEFGAILLPIVTQVVQALTQLALWFSSLPEPVQQFIVALGALLAVAGPVLVVMGTIVSSITTLIPLFTALIPIITAVSLPVLALIAALVALGAAIVWFHQSGTWQTWGNNMRMFGEITERSMQRVGNTLQESQRTWGQNFQNMGTLFDRLRERMVQFAARAIPQLIEAFRNIVPALQELGTNIMQGLINGIRSKIAEFIDMIRNTAEGAVNAIRNAFQISSPSKVMEGMGQNIIAGWEQGIGGGLQIPTPSTTSGRVPSVGSGGISGGAMAFGDVYITVPEGTTSEQADAIIRELGKRAKKRGASAL